MARTYHAARAGDVNLAILIDWLRLASDDMSPSAPSSSLNLPKPVQPQDLHSHQDDKPGVVLRVSPP